jgi:hypothetical protein
MVGEIVKPRAGPRLPAKSAWRRYRILSSAAGSEKTSKSESAEIIKRH